MKAAEFRKLVEAKGKLEAVRQLPNCAHCASEAEADAIIRVYIQVLLDARKYAVAALVLWGSRIFDPRPESVRQVWRGIENNALFLAQGASSLGKCLGKGTEVLMHSGKIKKVEDVEVGDLLMGDDSRPRRVLQLVRGLSKLYRINPLRSKSWICNEDHILSLRCNINKLNGDQKTISRNYTKGQVVDIPVKDWIKKSATFKEAHCQFQVGAEFREKDQILDPYIYGLWLGGGSVNLPVLHNQDPIIIQKWCSHFEKRGYRISINRKGGSDCHGYFVRTNRNEDKGRKSNEITDFVRSSFKGGEKRIRKEYLRGSRSQRLKLLAGLIDTDGYNAGCGLGITTKYSGLADDLVFLARSLGFFSSKRKYTAKIKSIGYECDAYKVYISGAEVRKIPSLLTYKLPEQPPKTDPTNQQFTVEDFGEGEYYGFTLSGNGRFLLGDFTVTHNSYSIIAWLLLDWWRDPLYTSVKLISTSAGHVRANTYSTLTMLHREAVITMPGEVFSEHVGLETSDKRACIAVVKIPQGDDGKGRLRGFHPIPRPKEHPTLGWMSRIRVFIDEAEEAPIGVWEGVDNLTSTISGTENLKIAGAYNPKNQGSKVAQLAEPKNGWESVDPERDISWSSKFNWHVERLDAKRCENVVQRKEVYLGLQTYEGYRLIELRRGGNTPEMWTFARGWYPPSGVAFNIIIPAYLNGCRGEFTFTGATMKFAGVDTATEGRDDAVLTAGRYGKAVSFQHESGKVIRFPEPRNAAQVDQQINLVKGSTSIVAHSIRDTCKMLQIPPDGTCLDRTGVGAVVHDLLKENEVWSPHVLGVDFNKAATETKVLEQDQETAEEMYDGVVTEVWFALAKWMEFNYIAISAGVDRDRLNSELLGRQYFLKGKKYRVRKKDEFKSDFGYSPDYADSLTIFLHAIRLKTQAVGSMTGKAIPPPDPRNMKHGHVDVVRYVDVSGV